VVVVADPQLPFGEAAAGALRKYASTAQKDGQRGKLVILAGATAGPDGKVAPTGLEGLLGDLGVSLGNQFVFGIPNEMSPDPRAVLAGFNPSESAARNPVIAAMSQSTGIFRLPTPREVIAADKPELEVQYLIATLGITWVEDAYPANIQDALRSVRSNPTVARQKLLTDDNRPLGVVVSQRPSRGAPADSPEGKAQPRAVVIGNGTLVSDGAAPERRASDPFTFALVGVSIDWLRSRPAFAATGVAAKKYREYQFPHPEKVSSTRLEYLPLGLTFLVVIGLGAGVWAVRRK
jgi:hypothetical protein